MIKFISFFIIINSLLLFSGNFEEQKTLTLTLPETNLIIKDIPTHNKNAAIAHVRALLEQIFSHLKNSFIKNAVDTYREYLNQPAPSPYMNSNAIVISWECQVAYDRHGEIIGCTGEPLDCTCVVVVGKRIFNNSGEITLK